MWPQQHKTSPQQHYLPRKDHCKEWCDTDHIICVTHIKCEWQLFDLQTLTNHLLQSPRRLWTWACGPCYWYGAGMRTHSRYWLTGWWGWSTPVAPCVAGGWTKGQKWVRQSSDRDCRLPPPTPGSWHWRCHQSTRDITNTDMELNFDSLIIDARRYIWHMTRMCPCILNCFTTQFDYCTGQEKHQLHPLSLPA